ncbi:MAG: prepilin-type N-terminal cleavage/methylation domain-containing protein [Betaproteobacteria bacterium]
MHCHKPLKQCGVTLIELVIVITITAIIAGAVAVFIARPVEGYIDAARRAELTDIADTALRRMTRDLRTALPNSIRIVESPPGSGVLYLEFLQTSGGGRYRAQADAGGGGDSLDFAAADASFDVIGALPAFAGGESIVVYNLAASGAVANAYAGDNRAAYASSAGSTITLAAATQFPFPSPGKRFQVVPHAVTYACNPINGELRRYWDYGILAAQPTPPATPNNALLASGVTACGFSYASGAGLRNGVVTLSLRIERAAEPIQLFQQVHVSNVP